MGEFLVTLIDELGIDEPHLVAPDDHTETVRRLSDLQGDDPMILTLARGHYCPKEHQQHLDLATFQPKVGVAYTQIVTIATDEHHELQEFRASVGAQWTLLGSRAARRSTTSGATCARRHARSARTGT